MNHMNSKQRGSEYMGMWLLSNCSSPPTLHNFLHLVTLRYVSLTYNIDHVWGHLRHINLCTKIRGFSPSLTTAFSSQTHQHQGVNCGGECFISSGVCVIKSG